MNSPEFFARRALITGGGGGIGLELALALAERGAQVHVADHDQNALLAASAIHANISAHSVDFADSAQIAAWIGGLAPDGIDILVNNVGISGAVAPIEALAAADWDRVLRINLDAAFHCIRAAAGALKARRGVILNISSAAAKAKPPDRVAYVVSKLGLEGLTLVAAQELGPAGVRVNAVRPGLVENPRWRDLVKRKAEQSGRTADELIAETLQQISLRRVVSQSEVVDLCLFLVSERAGAISGQIIGVDGHVLIGP